MITSLKKVMVAAVSAVIAGGALLASPANAIIGGSDATGDNRVVFVWNWQGTGYASCSGVPIRPNVVLTAAHCVTNNLGPSSGYNFAIAATPSNVYVSQPGVNMRSGAPVAVKQIIYTKQWVPVTGGNVQAGDMAALILATPLTGSIGISRLATNTEAGQLPFKQVTVLGYGKTDNYWYTSPTPRKVTLEAGTPLASIANLYGGPGSWIQVNPTPGYGPCSGDSGGPVVQEIAGQQVLVGITSFVNAAGCAAQGLDGSTPPVYGAASVGWSGYASFFEDVFKAAAS